MKKTKTASADHEAFYQAMCAEMQRQCQVFPETRVIELIAVVGRLAGYLIATAYPEERDLARATAIENMDRATKDVAQDAPDGRSGKA